MAVTPAQVEKNAQQHAAERIVANALRAASMAHKDIEPEIWILQLVQQSPDPNHRAAILAKVAKVLLSSGKKEKGLHLFRLALRAGMEGGRATVLRVVAEVTSDLDFDDQGMSLWKIYEVLNEVGTLTST